MENDIIEFDLMRYVHIFRRWLWVIILASLIGGMVGQMRVRNTPVYEAEADLASVKSLTQITLSPEYRTLSEAQIVQGLDVGSRQRALLVIGQGNEVASAVAAELGPSFTSEERQAPALVSSVKLTVEGDIIRIKVQHQDPRKASQIADTWARIYAAQVNQIYSQVPTSVEQLQVQADTAWTRYQGAEAALVKFIGESRTDVLAREIDARQKSISDLYAVRRNLAHLMDDATTLQAVIARDPAAASNDSGTRLAMLLVRANAATLSYPSSATASFSAPISGVGPTPAPSNSSSTNAPGFPIQLQIPSPSLNGPGSGSLGSQIDDLIIVLNTRQKQLETQIADPSLQTQVLALQKELEQQLAKKQELTSARDLAWASYKTLGSKIEEVTLAQQSNGSMLRSAGKATLPTTPIPMNNSLYILIGAAVGFILVTVFAFAVELTHPVLSSLKEATKTLTLPVYQVESGEANYRAPWKNGAARASPGWPYQYVASTLFLGPEPPRTVLIVSPDRGRSSCLAAADLGRAVAQMNQSVIVVDTDIVNPSLHQVLGVSNGCGWSDLLQHVQPGLPNCLQPTSIKNLRVLTAGSGGECPGEAIASSRLPSLLDALAENANCVILAGAPVSITPDSVFLAKSVKAVLLLLTTGLSTRDAAVQLKAQLQNVGANPVGIVLMRRNIGPMAVLARVFGVGG